VLARRLIQAWCRWHQPSWPADFGAALQHPIAGPLIRAGAWRLQRAERSPTMKTDHAPLPPADPAELGSPERLAILMLLSREPAGLTTDQITRQFVQHENLVISALVALLEDERLVRERRKGAHDKEWFWRVNVPFDHLQLTAPPASALRSVAH